jgi:hypothetical protein
MGRLINQGCQGHDVRAVQDVLNFHIRRLQPLMVDGVFGPLTHGRVVEFQKVNGLKADGFVGPLTLTKLFAEEQLPISLALVPTQPQPTAAPRGIQPPRLVPALTLPPLVPPLRTPLFLSPNSLFPIQPLTPAGQTMNFTFTTPVQNDPVDPRQQSFVQIVGLLSRLPPTFPFRAAIIGAVPKPRITVGQLEFDPVAPMAFGFKWGVKPLFDLKTIGPPPAFALGASVNARYVFTVINNPRLLVPQLGVGVRGDFGGTVDWTSNTAQSRPLFDLKGEFILGVEGRF